MCSNRLKQSMCVCCVCFFCVSVFSQALPSATSGLPPTFGSLFLDMNNDLTSLESITTNLNSNLQTVQTESAELKESLLNAETTRKQQEQLYNDLEADCNALKAQSQKYQMLLAIESGVIIGLSLSAVVLAVVAVTGQ